MNETPSPAGLSDLLPPPPPNPYSGGGFCFGRYRGPFDAPDLSRARAPRARLKHWHYLSVVNDAWFLGIGLVHLGFAGNAFAYLVDRRASADGERLREYEALSPLAAALAFAPSSVHGRTRWRSRGARVEIEASRGWRVSLDLPLGGARLRGELAIDPPDTSLGLLFPLGPDRPAYTHKAAGMAARGALRLSGAKGAGETIVDLSRAHAVSDWTRSYALRETRWKWAAFATEGADGSPLGLNLSAEVYDDANGDSQENALFVGGATLPLGGVHFALPSNPRAEPWTIRSKRGDEVALTFTPLGARAQALDLKLVKSDFIQPFGHFDGHVRGVPIAGAFGVVEDHLAVW
ncbi:MAG: DUF2804 domain-containing protein [Myxococcales bacterium]|nr:DUF2804 domain-containing protein [Myxococcales bacterium]